MNKGVKFRAYPNKEQRNLINQTLGCCRLIYNKGLAMRNDAFTNGEKIGYNQTSAMLTELKKSDDYTFLKVVDSIALQQSFKAVEKYGDRAAKIYEDRRKRQYPNFKNPEKYYEWYVEGETVDGNGNLLTTYNPNSRWDYYTVEETMTIGDLKKEREKYLANIDSSKYEMIWEIIVNEVKPSGVTGINLFSLLYGQPNKEELLRIYGTKENYINHYKNNNCASYSVLTPQGWMEPGKVGWFGMSSATFDEEKTFRETYYAKFIEPYENNTTVFRIDCHI